MPDQQVLVVGVASADDVVVSRLSFATCIARHRLSDSAHVLIDGLHPPEASAGQAGRLKGPSIRFEGIGEQRAAQAIVGNFVGQTASPTIASG